MILNSAAQLEHVRNERFAHTGKWKNAAEMWILPYFGKIIGILWWLIKTPQISSNRGFGIFLEDALNRCETVIIQKDIRFN